MPKKTIEKYLEDAAKVDLTGAAEVKKGDKIAVHYIGRLSDSEVFDTSVEEVAKAADKHNPHRDYSAGLGFTVGAGQMIAGFDKGVEGMKVGETKTLTIIAAEAYGERRDDLMVEVPMSQLPPKDGGFSVGDHLYTQQGHRLTISEVNDDFVTIDQNHELAGKDLIFDITIISID